MDDKSELYAKAYMGDRAKAFLSSDLGQYLLNRVEAEEKEAIEALVDAPCNAFDEIRSLQNKIENCRRFQNWLGELIIEGSQAINIIENEGQ